MTPQVVIQLSVFWGAWLLAGLALTRWRVGLKWDGGFHPPVLVCGGILLAAVVRRWLVIVAGFFVFFSSTFASGSLSERFLIVVSVLFLPYAVIEWYIGGRAARLERGIAGDSLPEHLKVAAGIYRLEMLRPLLLLILVLWTESASPGRYNLLIILPIVITAQLGVPGLRRRLVAGKQGRTMEFPDLSLKSEIARILGEANCSKYPLLVKSGRASGDLFKDPVIDEIWGGNFFWQKRQLVTSRNAIRHLEAPVYTAVFSRELASNRVVPMQATPGSSFHFRSACFALPLLIGILIVGQAISSSTAGPVTQAVVSFWPVILTLGYLFLWWRFESLHISRENYRRAYLNWHDADPDAERTVEQFVASLARGDAALQCIRSPEVAMGRLRKDEGLMRFLDLCGPETKDSALLQASTALHDQIIVAPDAEEPSSMK